MEVLAATLAEVVKCSVGSQISHLIHYKKYAEDLKNKVDDLKSLRKDVSRRVSAAKMRGEIIYQVVERWLMKVETILEDAMMLYDEAIGINSCFKGWCCGRYRLIRKSKMMMDIVTELLYEARNLGEVSTLAPMLDIELMLNDGFEAFESTKAAMELVMKELMNDRMNIIGVHGMGGVGKTTLMKKIGNQVKMSKLFDTVIMVSVSRNYDLKTIQDEIAEELCLSLGQERGESRARRLFSILKQKTRVLIILDDVWKTLDLSEVGIPWGEHNKGCKIVLTTRRQDVCNMMETQVNVRLECLSEADSWYLFRKNAGNEVDASDLNEVAIDVAKECKGLPVALVTLGRAMREKDRSVWENVLQQLRESDFTYIEDMDSRVFEAIKLSYDYLPYQETKSIFLFCCLFPEDHKIGVDELLWYMMGEGLLKEVNLKQAKRKLDRVVETLTSSHLLLKGDRDGCVLMHDVIRDVAIIIATKDHGFIVRAGRGLKGWPEKEMLANCTRLSLMGNEISLLPEQPDCPNILTLVLSRCQSLKYIPENFFEGMKSLKTLDLGHTPIESLPSSLACLANLRLLCLDGCSGLQDVSLIGKLKKLEIIILRKTSVKVLPILEIREFSNLKLLSLES